MNETLIKAKLSRLRIAPRKVRLVADLVRGKSAEEARHILRFTTKAAAKPISKLLDSGIANARHNFKIEVADLRIKSILVNEGPPLKRFRPESRGRVASIQKKTSHINLVLSSVEPEKNQEKEKSVKKIVKKNKSE
jgi:large subunit ribosomal protein L22